MRIHPLVRIALAACPSDYRREYQRSIALDMEARGQTPSAVALDLLYQGISMQFEMFWRDLTFALRTLAKSPMYVAVAGAAIALAIGCNVAVGSVIDGVLLRPLPYPHAERLVQIDYDRGFGQFSYLDARDYRKAQTTLEQFGLRTDDDRTLSGITSPVTVHGSQIDEGYFAVLGAHPQAGRFFTAADLGSNNIVISDALWRKYFAGDPSAVGKFLTLNGKRYSIAGVAPRGFRDISAQGLVPHDFWLPIDPHGNVAVQRGYTNYDAWALTRPGVSLAAAGADANRVMRGIVHRYPAFHAGWTSADVSGAFSLIVGGVQQMIWLMYAGALVLLVIACANVINLTLVRAAARERDLLMRSALGATRKRIAWQLITEMSIISLVGGIAGVALGWASLTLFNGYGAAMIPRWEGVRIDASVVVYVAVLLAVTTIVTGVAPAFARRRDLVSGLKAAGRSGDLSGAKRLRVGLVVSEIALTLALIVCAGLTLRSFITLTHAELGFDARGLYAIALPSFTQAYPNYDSQLRATQRLVSAVRNIPGVQDAASTTVAPFKGGFIVGTTIPGRTGTFEIDGNAVAPEYFRVMRIPLLRGRTFLPSDGPHARSVTIVNASLARHFFGTIDVLGRRIKPGIASGNTPSQLRTIVGVVADTRDGFTRGMMPQFYLPDTQLQSLSLIVARTDGRAFAFAGAVSRAYAAVDASFAPPEVQSYDTIFAQKSGRWRAAAMLFGVLAAAALILALAGIYAVTAYSVAQRTQEFGIRKAIGASDGAVLRAVVADALRQAGVGIAAGLVLASAGTQLLQPLLYQTSPFDPLTYAGVIALIVVCAAGASLVPAVRATRVQPARALRYE